VQDVGDHEFDASRRRFMQLAAPVAAGGLAAFVAACGSSSDPQTADDKSSDAQAPEGGRDLEIVQFALLLEHVEADFYDQVVESGVLSGAADELFKEIRQNEHEHVDALTALAKKLGGTPDEAPTTTFPLGDTGSGVIELAATIENLGAAAYLGQAEHIENREVLAAALSIHSVEGRHAAKLSRLAGRNFSPDGSFASPLSMEEVNDAVERFLV
jgi:rubrerythrin